MDRIKIYPWQTDTAGCWYQRLKLPLDALERAYPDEFEVCWTCEPKAGEGDTRSVVLGQRIMGHGTEGDPRWLDYCRNPGILAVYEIDDDILDLDPGNTVPYNIFTPNRQGTIRNIAAADWVIASTPKLGIKMERLKTEHDPDRWDCIMVAKNCVADGSVIEREAPSQGAPLTIGWAGSMFHQQDFPPSLVEQLAAVRDAHPDVRWLTIGANYLGWGDHLGWGSIENYHAALRHLDIGIAPIARTPFNASKCLDAATRVTSSRGVVEIKEIEPGDRVWHDRQWIEVEAVEHQPQRSGLLVTTHLGYQIRLTTNHRMQVDGEWKVASDLSIGDRLSMEPETVWPTRSVVVPWPAESRQSRRAEADHYAWLAVEDGPRLEITPRWGRFLGAFAGDGNASQSTAVQISCDGQDQDWIDLLVSDFRAMGMHPTTEQKIRFDGSVLRRRSVRVANSNLVRLLQSLGVVEYRSEDGKVAARRAKRVVGVPEVIWRSPRDVIAEFVAALFETDGCVTSSGAQVVSKDEQMMRDVQRLLLLFGVMSKLRKITNRAQNGFVGIYWSVTLRRAELDVFAKEIGFRSQRKIARLSGVTTRPHSNAYRPMAWSDEIVSIERCPVDPVDIQVAGEVFAAAGMVSHNSWIKALDYMAAGVVPVVEDWGQYPELIGETDKLGLAHGVASYVEGWLAGGSFGAALGGAVGFLRRGLFDHHAIAERAREFEISRQVYRWAEVFRKAAE